MRLNNNELKEIIMTLPVIYFSNSTGSAFANLYELAVSAWTLEILLFPDIVDADRCENHEPDSDEQQQLEKSGKGIGTQIKWNQTNYLFAWFLQILVNGKSCVGRQLVSNSYISQDQIMRTWKINLTKANKK